MEAVEKKSRVTDFFEQLDQSRARDAQRYGRLVSGPCNVGNTSSHIKTEVMDHWAWIVLGWRPFGNSRCCWQKPMPGFIAGACKPSRWAANSFKASEMVFDINLNLFLLLFFAPSMLLAKSGQQVRD